MSQTTRHRGLLIVLCGPSGVGKSTISRALEERQHIWYTVSVTTRPKQPQDSDGKTYEHINKRFRAAKREIHMAKGSRAFDYMVINDNLDRAVEEIVKIIRHKRSGGI